MASSLSPKTRQSFQDLKTKIDSGLCKPDASDINKALDGEQDRLQLALTYFKVVQTSKAVMDASNTAFQPKWSKASPETEQLSQELRNLVIIPLVEQLSLEAQSVFDLCDNYFQKNPHLFHWFHELEKSRNKIALQQQPQMMMGGFQRSQYEQQSYDKFALEMKDCCKKIVQNVKQFYFTEREALLQCLKTLMAQSQPTNDSQRAVKAFFETKLVGEKLVTNLIQSLMRNLKWESELSYAFQDEAKETFMERVQTEQIFMLTICFQVFFSHQVKLSSPEQNEFLDYLLQTDFNGQCHVSSQLYQHKFTNINQVEKTAVIKNLGQLCALALVGLQVEPLPQLQITHKIESQSLSQASVLVYLPILIRMKTVDTVKDKLSQLPLLEEVKEILQSDLLTKPQYQGFKGQFMELLQKWLDILFEFESQKKNPNDDLLQEIQSYGVLILKDKLNISRVWKQGYQSLKMFKQYFDEPQLWFEQLLPLLDTLSGRAKFPHATKVLQFLKDKGLVKELFAWISVKLQKLRAQQLQPEELAPLTSACVILAKIVKQDYRHFQQLNDEYRKIANDHRQHKMEFESLSGRSPFRSSLAMSQQRKSQSANVHLESGDLPVLSLLSKILHEFFMVHINFGQRCVVHMIDALREILKEGHSLEVIQELKIHRTQKLNTQTPMLIEFTHSIIFNELQQQPNNHKLTCSMLHFMTTLFKEVYPQECLDQDDQTRLDHSFLVLALEKIYQPLIQRYFTLAFDDSKSMFACTYRLLSLTRVLLLKFDQVPDNGQKLLLSMPMPKFEIMLEAIKESVNQEQVYQVALNCLQLSDTTSATQQFENRFVADLQKPSRQEEITHNPKVVRWIQKMTQISLQVLNTLLSLSLTDNLKSADRVSRQTHYLRQLLPIKNLHHFVLNQTSQSTTEGKLIDFPSMIAYYIAPSNYHLNQPFISSEALRFLTLCMRILKTDLHQPLKQIYGLNLHNQLMAKFVSQLEEGRSLDVSYVEFWIVAVDKQPHLVQQMWKATDAKHLATYLQKAQDLKHRNACLKLSVLVSLMAEKRCCIDTVEYNQHMVMEAVYSRVIEVIIKDLPEVQPFNGHYLYSNKELEAARCQEAVTLSNYKLCLQYYLRALQSEFSRVPSSNILRIIIKKLGDLQKLVALGTRSSQDHTSTLLQLTDKINAEVFREVQFRDMQRQSITHNYHRSQPSFNFNYGMLTNDQQQYDGVLQTNDGTLLVNGLNGQELSETLAKTPAYSLMNTLMYQEGNYGNGLMGCGFAVDIQELEYTMRQECYESSEFRSQVSCIFKEYNLVMSDLYTDQLVLKAKSDFFLSIGQTQMREASTKVDASILITASMLPLVSNEELYPKNESQVDQQKKTLIQHSKTQVTLLQQVLQKFQNSNQSNILIVRTYDTVLQNLIVHLGALGHLAKQSSNAEDPYQLNYLVQNLLYIMPDLNVKADATSQHQFGQVVLLVFQILSTFKSNPQEQPVLKTLGRLMHFMKTGVCFSEGLQILNLACDVLSTQEMNRFMQKQDSSVLRMILGRLSDPRATTTEFQQVLTLLQTYAGTLEGSLHLHQVKLLEQFSECQKRLQEQDPYIAQKNAQVRNQVHMQWLQILLLVRQMNVNLIKTPRTENIGYFKSCCQFVASFQRRFIQVLDVCTNKEGSTQSAVASLAVYEEIELLVGLVSQVFEHADLWAEVDNQTYCNIKDCVLFAVPSLFTTHLQQQQSLMPSSVTEHHLALMKYRDRTALTLKIEMSLVKTMLSCAASLHNVLSIQKETSTPLVNTWGQAQPRYDEIPTMFNTFIVDLQGCPMQYAFENYLRCMEKLKGLLVDYRSDEAEIDKLVKQTADLFLFNQWIQSEYQGGIAATLVEEDLNEMCETLEVTLGMGMFIVTALLEQVRLQLGQMNGGYVPYQNFNISGTMSRGGNNPFDQSQRGGQTRYQQTGGGYLEESSVRNMGQQLMRFVEKVSATVDWDGQRKGVWGDNPKNYLETLCGFAAEVVDNPSNTHSYY